MINNKNAKSFGAINKIAYFCQLKESDMSYTQQNIIIKKPSSQLLKAMKQWGERKAERLQKAREDWEAKAYQSQDVIQL